MLKGDMFKIEKKLVQLAEKYMYLLMALFASAIALYLRRPAVWWTSPDVGAYFDGHINHTQSAMYYALVRMIQHLPMLPLHSLKWIVGIADFAVALLCISAVSGREKSESLKKAVFYTIFIMSPVVYLRGILWAQPDALAFVLLMGAYLLWKRERKLPAVLLVIVGVTLYPPFFLLATGYLWFSDNGVRERNRIFLGILAAGFLALQGFCSMALGNSWQEGIRTCFRWLAYEPYEGKLFEEGLAWV